MSTQCPHAHGQRGAHARAAVTVHWKLTGLAAAAGSGDLSLGDRAGRQYDSAEKRWITDGRTYEQFKQWLAKKQRKTRASGWTRRQPLVCGQTAALNSSNPVSRSRSRHHQAVPRRPRRHQRPARLRPPVLPATGTGSGCGVPCPRQGSAPGKRNVHLDCAFFLPCNLGRQNTGPMLRFVQCKPSPYPTP